MLEVPAQLASHARVLRERIQHEVAGARGRELLGLAHVEVVLEVHAHVRQLLDVVDVVYVNYYPYWSGVAIDDALPTAAVPQGNEQANSWKWVAQAAGPVFSGEKSHTRTSTGLSQHFFTGAKRLFDHVIVDCPAVLVSSEPRILAPLADAVLVVVGAGRASFSSVRQCLQILESVGGSIAGIVVNGVQPSTNAELKNELDLFYQEGEKE